jgi:hypothetical protein
MSHFSAIGLVAKDAQQFAALAWLVGRRETPPPRRPG